LAAPPQADAFVRRPSFLRSRRVRSDSSDASARRPARSHAARETGTGLASRIDRTPSSSTIQPDEIMRKAGPRKPYRNRFIVLNSLN